MNTNDFDFDLPEELIAQTPLEKRDSSKLLIIDHEQKTMIDSHFDHIIDQLNPGDALVMNNTRVLPARLYGEKPDTHGHVELLLLKNTHGDQWEVLAKPAKRLKVGSQVSFGDGRLTATIVEELEHGGRIVEFNYEGIFLEVLESLGEMPLPPYIHEKLDDAERYQTVYAKENGSAAAPTAGLHFTTNLLSKIEAKGVHLVYLTLHVGLGTFRPVSVDNLDDHDMHSEFYSFQKKQHKHCATSKKLEAALSLLEPHLFVHWKPSEVSSKGTSKLILVGPIFLLNQATNLRLLMPSRLISIFQNQLLSCLFPPLQGVTLSLMPISMLSMKSIASSVLAMPCL